MYFSLGMTRADCAKFFHVTERTLHNWESGYCAIPYAAYRLLRIHCGYQLLHLRPRMRAPADFLVQE
jgi:transcriptional regulator with XRE-family HTH domain